MSVVNDYTDRVLTPDEYFQIIKSKKQTISDEQLLDIYNNCLELLNKYKLTGQTRGMRKLLFHLECIEKERDIVATGFNEFIYRDDIEDYIDNIAKDVVKIIEIKNYEREIPDRIVHVIEEVGSKFDELYVVFTDYTGKVERRIEKEHRSTDPILFGTFQNEKSRAVIDRFYYLGDWEDEFCDLTLDKMVNEVKTKANRDIVHTIKTPEDIEELKAQLNMLSENNRANGPDFRTNVKTNNSSKKSLFNRIFRRR